MVGVTSSDFGLLRCSSKSPIIWNPNCLNSEPPSVRISAYIVWILAVWISDIHCSFSSKQPLKLFEKVDHFISTLFSFRSSSAAFPLPGSSRTSVDPLLEKSTINANTNRNIASGSRVAASDAIPENAALHFDNSIRQMAESGLPPTVGYLVLLWEEIRSYCIHAILQQVKFASSNKSQLYTYVLCTYF